MPSRLIIIVAAVFLGSPVSAQQLSLQIQDGRVTLDATQASVRQILAEWSRVGGTRVVNAERINGAPVTLKLENVSERQALEVILRSVAGYVAAPRAAAASGASMYDRIMVLPTSTPPPAAPAGRAAGGSPRFQPPRPADAAATDEPTDADPGAAFTFPQPGVFNPQPGVGQPAFGQPGAAGENVFTPAQPAQGGWSPPTQPPQQGNNPFAPTQPTQPVQTPFGVPFQPVAPNGVPTDPTAITFNPPPVDGPAPAVPQPGAFGVVGTPVPGVVQQPGQPTQPGQPVQPGQPTQPGRPRPRR